MSGQPNHDLAQTLRTRRLDAGLTQEELADRSGVSPRTISDVERGIRSRVYPETARRLSSALDLGGEEARRFIALCGGAPRGSRLEITQGLPPTPLVGRSDELRTITEAIVADAVRLVTLTGPGGVGKTRLALEVARLTASRFPSGVFFVSLGELDRASLVPTALARALGVVESDEDPEALIARRLSQGRHLILLDTFEHVLGAAAIVHALVLKCPATTFLVTSRTALRLRAEHEFQVPPLALPPEQQDTVEQSVTTWPATALFVERALAVRPQLVIDDDARLIVEICRRLEGLPLAIELAASRVKHLPLKVLRDQLEDRLRLLVRGGIDFPPRQRTMRDTIAWSHDLLGSEEQVLFRRLSVFAGGGDLEAIDQVCDAPDGVLELLSSLLDKSLIFLSEDGPAGRYDMLDVIREYGVERLSEASETQAVCDRHAQHYLRLAEDAEPGLVTSHQSRWISRLELEHNNLGKALGWLIERGDSERALRFVVALWRYWRHSGRLIEGRHWCESAIALPGDAPLSLLAKAHWATAALAFPQGDYQRMAAVAAKGLAYASEAEDPMDLRNAHTMIGLVALCEGRYAEALEPLGRALSLCQDLGRSWQLGTSYLNLGLALLHCGDLDAAERTLADGLEIYTDLGDETFAARTKVALSHVALAREDMIEAESLARAGLSAFAAMNERQGLAEALVTIAAIRAATGAIDVAAELYGAATALRDAIAARPAPFDDVIPERFLRDAHERMRSVLEEVSSRGRSLGVEAAVAKALRS